MKNYRFYDTVQIREVKNGRKEDTILQVYITNKWPIPAGAKCWFTIRGIEEPVENETRVRKVLRRTGTGRKITCNRVWGYKEGDWVIISLQIADNPDDEMDGITYEETD